VGGGESKAFNDHAAADGGSRESKKSMVISESRSISCILKDVWAAILGLPGIILKLDCLLSLPLNHFQRQSADMSTALSWAVNASAAAFGAFLLHRSLTSPSHSSDAHIPASSASPILLPAASASLDIIDLALHPTDGAAAAAAAASKARNVVVIADRANFERKRKAFIACGSSGLHVVSGMLFSPSWLKYLYFVAVCPPPLHPCNLTRHAHMFRLPMQTLIAPSRRDHLYRRTAASNRVSSFLPSITSRRELCSVRDLPPVGMFYFVSIVFNKVRLFYRTAVC
jgi:hypothetical protein